MRDGMMADGINDLSRDLRSIQDGAASFDTRARFELHLLDVLRHGGAEAVGRLLVSLPGFDFRRAHHDGPESVVRFLSSLPDAPPLIVDTFSDAASLSINVTVLSTEEPPEPHPWHRAFYQLWERLGATSDADAAGLDETQRAVFLAGRLEAELMNGGFGQYLANTDGVHLDATLALLTEIGATRTRELLEAAVKLCLGMASYVEAWDVKTDEFTRLDDAFLDAGEDLAGLTADRFLM